MTTVENVVSKYSMLDNETIFLVSLLPKKLSQVFAAIHCLLVSSIIVTDYSHYVLMIRDGLLS